MSVPEESSLEWSANVDYINIPNSTLYDPTVSAGNEPLYGRPQLPQFPSPQQQQLLIDTEVVGRRFIVRLAPGYLDEYQSYFNNLFGQYDAQTNTWSFPRRRENDVRNLIIKIQSGQLLPPDQLPVPSSEEIKIDLETAGQLPIRRQHDPTVIVQQAQPVNIPSVSVPTPQVAPVHASSSATQVVQAAMTTPIVEVSRFVPTQAHLPEYDSTKKDPSESTAAYERRVQLYEYLLSIGLTEQTADVLSRMRNNVDIMGVEYNKSAMNVLNTYLPIQQ